MSSMSNADKLLSDLVAYRTYAKYLKNLNRRESLTEAIERNMQMHMDRYPSMTDEIANAYTHVHAGEVMPSMRGLQFGGIATIRNNIRQYNCSFHNIDRVAAFQETLYLLLCGTGVGFSVQWHHVKNLPKVHLPRESMFYAVHDSIEGWAMALGALMDAFFYRKPEPQFDFFQIRPEGTLLETTGGRAPGPAKLEKMLRLVRGKLMKAVGRQLRPLEAHDILCIVSDCVRAGGIREAALISLFDRFDDEMLKCKSGSWWEEHPYRGRANNSAVMPRDEVTYEEFVHVYTILRLSGSGEPGLYWTNNKYLYGANPCVEIALRNKQFCNLTTVNQATVKSMGDLLTRIKAATLIGTLQAGYTDFPFLDDEWRQVTEQDALIGVSFTGIADNGGFVTPQMLREGASVAVRHNREIASRVGHNPAARVTTGKPEGSSSAILGTSSGLHARHELEEYLRRVRLKANTPLVEYLYVRVPELLEVDLQDSDKVIITIPQRSPVGAISRTQETAMDLFSRAMMYNQNWVAPGHVYGDNKNNMSCTISVRDDEWAPIMAAMWDNRELYNGLSLLPYDGGTYVQAPFEACTKDTYNKYMSYIKPLDFTEIKEYVDTTEQSSSVACGGGACEIL